MGEFQDNALMLIGTHDRFTMAIPKREMRIEPNFGPNLTDA